MFLTPFYTRAIDDLIRADLISHRDWYAGCIFWSTLAVVVGCAMEVPEVLHELWSRLFPKKSERLIKIVASIGLGFVVLGVAGELGFEHWRAAYEGLLQNFENILLVDAERHAASAQEDAGDAATSAKIAHKESVAATAAAGNALNIASGARREADSFKGDIVSAKTQAADAETRLADATRRTLRLEQELTWRIVTADQATKIKEYLAPYFFSPQFRGLKITFAYGVGDVEASEYADDLKAALSSALDGFGVTFEEPQEVLTMGGPGSHPTTGLIMGVRQNDGIAGTLQRALLFAGIKNLIAPDKDRAGMTIEFFVGAKPRPPALPK